MLEPINPIQLCSRCTVHEIASWTFDNQLKLDEDVIKEIREELKDIKLKEGECIVCTSKTVADNCFEGILKVLEKNKTSKEAANEFKKLFGLDKKELAILL